MPHHHKLDYVEFAAHDLAATKTFFAKAFGWTFTDYGPDYVAFDHQGLEGGFYRAPMASIQDQGGALLVFYSERLEETARAVTEAGGVIVKPIFDFPGGRRFQFTEPSGNELAVWSEK